LKRFDRGLPRPALVLSSRRRERRSDTSTKPTRGFREVRDPRKGRGVRRAEVRRLLAGDRGSRLFDAPRNGRIRRDGGALETRTLGRDSFDLDGDRHRRARDLRDERTSRTLQRLLDARPLPSIRRSHERVDDRTGHPVSARRILPSVPSTRIAGRRTQSELLQEIAHVLTKQAPMAPAQLFRVAPPRAQPPCGSGDRIVRPASTAGSRPSPRRPFQLAPHGNLSGPSLPVSTAAPSACDSRVSFPDGSPSPPSSLSKDHRPVKGSECRRSA